jgi:hypothetical protein
MAGVCTVGGLGTLNDDFPTGYDAFYCMKWSASAAAALRRKHV